MASTSSISSYSYTDIQELVTQSLTDEQTKIDTAETKKAAYKTAQQDWSSIKSSLTSFKSSLSSLTSSSVFYGRTATSSDGDIVTASCSSSAAITSYKLTNISLAQAAVQAGVDLKFNDNEAYQGTKSVRSSTESIGTSIDPNKLLNDAANNIDLTAGGTTYAFEAGSISINDATITIDPAKDTLYTVVSKINSSTANVSAKLVKNGEAYTLQLTSLDDGDEEITIDSDTTNFAAIMRIDGESAFTAGVDPYWQQTISYVASHYAASPLSAVQDGYFMINGVTFAVDADSDSLQSVINRINNSQAGVSVMYDENLDRLSVTSKETGEDIEFGDDFQLGDTSGFLSNVLGLDLSSGKYTAEHSNASVTINGTVLTPEDNTFTLNGTTFTLHADSTSGGNIEISRDTTSAETAIKTMISSYNTLSDLLDTKSADEQPLEGDRLISQVRSQLRSLVIGEIENPGEYSFLSDIGITYDDGELSLDSSDLADAFRNNPDSVAQLFGYDSDGNGLRNDGGIANTINNNFISALTLASTGSIARQIDYLDLRIDRMDSKIERLQEAYDKREEYLWNEYTRLAEASAQLTASVQTMNSRLSTLSSSS